jgi:hypothetical protein
MNHKDCTPFVGSGQCLAPGKPPWAAPDDTGISYQKASSSVLRVPSAS